MAVLIGGSRSDEIGCRKGRFTLRNLAEPKPGADRMQHCAYRGANVHHVEVHVGFEQPIVLMFF